MDTGQYDELFQFYVDLIHYLFKAQDYVHMLWKKKTLQMPTYRFLLKDFQHFLPKKDCHSIIELKKEVITLCEHMDIVVKEASTTQKF